MARSTSSSPFSGITYLFIYFFILFFVFFFFGGGGLGFRGLGFRPRVVRAFGSSACWPLQLFCLSPKGGGVEWLRLSNLPRNSEGKPYSSAYGKP